MLARNDILEMLKSFPSDGSLVVIDGDPIPFNGAAFSQTLKLGFIKKELSSGWQVGETYTITNKGRRAMGIDVPLSLFERLAALWPVNR